MSARRSGATVPSATSSRGSPGRSPPPDDPSFLEGLLEVEAGDPPHIVVAPAHRRAVVRAKHRRLEFGPWALTCIPRVDGPSFRLYRRDLDPFLTEDLSGSHPDVLAEMIARFYEEAERSGDGPFVR